MIKYFNSIEEAKEFIKENNIQNYYFTTPEFLEKGVDLNWEEQNNGF